jgi:NifU-like protein involved in Fe-S cluster formation
MAGRRAIASIPTVTLYTRAILRLAASIPHMGRLERPQASAERTSRVCGSRVAVDLILNGEGKVAGLGLEVRACALGQASASLMANHAFGHTGAELVAARDALRFYLEGRRDDPGEWPGLAVFAEARRHAARHAAILLPFDAAADAATAAVARSAT